MARFLNSIERLGAIIGGRRKRPGRGPRRAARRQPARRLHGMETLEPRMLLAVAPVGGDHGLAFTTPGVPEPTPPSRLIVRLDDSVPLDSVSQVATDMGATLLREVPSIHGAIIQINTAGQDYASAMSTAVAAWSAHPGIRYAEADSEMHVDSTAPNDPLYSQQWDMHNTGQQGGTPGADIHAPEGWDISTGSSSIVVADIDTGVDYNHPDLAANMWVNPNAGLDGWVNDIHGINAITGTGDPMDDHGHGTHTSGTIGAVGNNGVGVAGVNWNVQIMALKFLSAGGFGATSDAITCIDYMTMQKTLYGVNVVASNNSWGGGMYSQGLYDAIKASNDAGILFVAAAGNYGYDNDMFPSYPASYNLPGIIAVAATDNQDNLAYFSQYGKTSVDLGAPGVGILSTLPASLYGVAYQAWDGTSMATPHVTGAVALGMAVDPTATPDFIKQQIMATVDPSPSLLNTTVTGGRLNVYSFLRSFNWAPVLNATGMMSLRPIEQDYTTSFGTRITAILQSNGPNPITDPNANDPQGIAITAADATNGSWQYTTNNGGTWKDLGRPSNTSARLLAANTVTRIRFVPNPQFNGTVTPAITFRAWDQTRGSNGGTYNASKTGGRTAFSTGVGYASITVTKVNIASVNRAPVLDASLNYKLPMLADNGNDAGASVQQILASGGPDAAVDPDGKACGIALTFADPAHGSWQYLLDGGSTWTDLLNSPSNSAALLLDDGARIRFLPSPGFSGTLAAALSFRAWDTTTGTNGGVADTTTNGDPTAFSAETATASITVNAAPTLNMTPSDQLQLASILENDVSSTGTSIAAILQSWPAANPLPVITDPDPNAKQGIAIVGVNTNDGAWGEWQYQTPGANWLPVDSVSNSSALLLAADSSTRLRFVAGYRDGEQFVGNDFNTADGIPTLIFRAWDQATGTNGGTGNASDPGGRSAFSGTTGTIAIQVAPVNQPPTLALDLSPSVLENSGSAKFPAWATVSTGPANESSQTVDVSILSNDNPGLFLVEPTIDSTSGDLTFTPLPYASGKATLSVQARDNGGIANGGQDTSSPATFTVTITPVNQPPSFTVGPDQTVDEHAPPQSVSGWATNISCGQGDTEQTLTFVVDNSNAALFAQPPAITPDGTLTYTLASHAVGSATITVTLHDNGGTDNGGIDTSAPQTFTIEATPVNDPPTALAQSLGTDSNQSMAITLTGDDGDPEMSPRQKLTYTITSSPALGTISNFDAATGNLTYTPKAGASGPDSFTFAVTDDDTAGSPANLSSTPATVQIWVDPVVQVTAAAGSNSLTLHLVGGKLQLDVAAGAGVRKLFTAPLVSVHKLTVLGTAGRSDQLTVDFSGGSFALSGGVVFDGASTNGADTLSVRGTPGRDTFVVAGDHVEMNGLPIALQNVGQVKLDGRAGNDTSIIASLDRTVRISDSAGVDTLDFSQLDLSQAPAGAGVRLDLRKSAGQLQTSFTAPGHPEKGRLALTGTFENVVGTPGGDTIWGNSARNVIHGGAGNNVLYGGAGGAVLVGGADTNTLYAGTGRAILIGGAGKSVLRGASNDTILIGGTTKYDTNDAALSAILAEWSSTRTFNARVTRLKNGVGPNKSVFLRLNDSVFDSASPDRLIGGKSKDWFLGFPGDSIENSRPGDITG